MVSKFIDFENLSEDSFIGVQSGSNLKIKPRIKNSTNNKLRITNDGLEVLADAIITEYALSWSNNGTAGSTDTRERRLLQVTDSFLGYIHLDFKPRNRTGEVARLPDNAPTPNKLIEVQTFDGGTVWITANSRAVHSNGLTANTRYIIDLFGFFN